MCCGLSSWLLWSILLMLVVVLMLLALQPGSSDNVLCYCQCCSADSKLIHCRYSTSRWVLFFGSFASINTMVPLVALVSVWIQFSCVWFVNLQLSSILRFEKDQHKIINSTSDLGVKISCNTIMSGIAQNIELQPERRLHRRRTVKQLNYADFSRLSQVTDEVVCEDSLRKAEWVSLYIHDLQHQDVLSSLCCRWEVEKIIPCVVS